MGVNPGCCGAMMSTILLTVGCACRYWYFTHADVDRTGTVTRVEWADGMRTVLALKLPWLHLFPQLTTQTADGSVNYSRFLDR